jgi:small subunit ribosomal protein S20
MSKPTDKNKKVKRPQALKRDLQNEQRRLRNRSTRANVKTAMRHLDDAIKSKDAPTVTTCLNSVYSVIDKAVKKGVFTRNKANRSKSRLAARAVLA